MDDYLKKTIFATRINIKNYIKKILYKNFKFPRYKKIIRTSQITVKRKERDTL